jgi:hypothetical protein
MTLKNWLQLFRAQTAVATLLLLLTPFLNNYPLFSFQTGLLVILFILIHYFSFGQNSLMDFAMKYDQKDINKRHHPLLSGAISAHSAHNLIHWGLVILTILAGLATLRLASSPALALLFLLGWVAFGHAYNDGLSKESPVGFLAISLCMTCAGVWAWLLSHNGFSLLGYVYFGYVFFTILYQISWSGFVKEMQVNEKSNILSRMGAHLGIKAVQISFRYGALPTSDSGRIFYPERSRYYALFVKSLNLLFGAMLLWLEFSLVRLVIFGILATLIAFYLSKAIKTRVYVRQKELMQMSLMEIFTIFLPIPLLLNPLVAGLLMIASIIYFFGINKILWGVPYPKV